MPTFDILPLNEARANSATGQCAALLQEYIGYIQRVAPGQAGKLEARSRARRRRLSGAGSRQRLKRWGRNCRSAAPPMPSTSGRRRPRAAAGPARTRPRSLPPRVPCPTTRLFLRTLLLLPNQLPSCRLGNSNEKLRYSWAVDLDNAGDGDAQDAKTTT